MSRILGWIMSVGGAICLGLMWSVGSPKAIFKYGVIGNLLVFAGIYLSSKPKSKGAK